MTVKQTGSAATTGCDDELWAMADTLPESMNTARYKHVMLGLIFLKYISDAFDERHAAVLAEWGDQAGEERAECIADNIFWVPREAGWAHLKTEARQPTVVQTGARAMTEIERDNPALTQVLPKEYAWPALDRQRLGQVIAMIGNIGVGQAGARSLDVLGRVYECFLSRFASAEGNTGGEFFTPRCVVRLLVQLLEPYRGRVYDPCCGCSGMFVQSVEFIRAHATGNATGGVARGDISIYGQDSTYTTWRLAKMNLPMRRIGGQVAHGDSCHNDRLPDLKADCIFANPPFRVSDRGGERRVDDKRWRYGVPPKGNASFAWVQHFVHRLAPKGVLGFVLANGSMWSSQSGEDEIRKNRMDAELVDCMVALPGQHFYSIQIPTWLWFIDARVDRTRRELTGEAIGRIAVTYHAWRTEEESYSDVPGSCKGVSREGLRTHRHVLTPGRYVGVEPPVDDGEPFEEKMAGLVVELREQQVEGAWLDAAVAENLKALGFGGKGHLNTGGVS